MDKFMIDPPTIQRPELDNQVVEKEPIVISDDVPKMQHTYYEPVLNSQNEIVLEEIEEQPSYRWFSIIGLIIFVAYLIYYAFKYMQNKDNYLIKQNAKSFDVTLDELKSDVKDFLKAKYEQFMDWKEHRKMSTNKYIFNKHVENGTLKVNKHKPINLLSMFA